MKEVEQQVQRWYEALQTGDADAVTQLYAPDALLLSTLQGDVKIGHPPIQDYFANGFLPKKPVGTTVEMHTRVLGEVAVNAGLYDFEVDDGEGGRATVQARFTFVYRHNNGDWQIIEHHSSLKPS